VKIEKSEKGYIFDFSLLRRYINLAKKCGMEYYEISHFFSQWGSRFAPNIEVFEKVVPIFVSLSKQYRVCDIREIFEYCRNKNGTFNFSAINRIRLLVNILYNEKNGRLDLPINEFMHKAYDFSDLKTVHKSEIQNFLTNFAQDYARQASTDEIIILRSELTMKGLIDTFEKIFKCLVKTSRPTKEGIVDMERVELLWKEKEYYCNSDLSEKVYILADFLNLIEEK
jgi:hypothetical protein